MNDTSHSFDIYFSNKQHLDYANHLNTTIILCFTLILAALAVINPTAKTLLHGHFG